MDELMGRLGIDVIQCAVLVLGVSEVLLAKVNNVWLYPAGILATVLSIYSLLGVGLYAECMLHFYYLVMSVYGWWYWITKRGGVNISVTHATQREWYITIGIILGSWLLLFLFLVAFTPSQNPVWDSWISATGWAGMWLLARRKVENWIILNISNAFAIPLLLIKALPLFAVLTAFLFIVACLGYFDWVKIAKVGVAVSEKTKS